MNKNKRSPELIQFVRSKGKMVPLVENNKITRDRKGKVVMVREKGLPRGILVAGMINGKVRIGWSYTNTKMGDVFNKEFGLNVAMGRMVTPSRINRVPHNVIKILKNSFIPRCEAHFDCAINNWNAV